MKKHLQLILSLLCVMALVFGLTAALAEETEYEDRIISIKWDDDDNSDQLRPTEAVQATLAGVTAELTEGNGWTGIVSVPVDTGNDWELVLPGKAGTYYTRGQLKPDGQITRVTYYYKVASPTSVQAKIKWEGDDRVKELTRKPAKLALYKGGELYGEPLSGTGSVTWKDLPSVIPGTSTKIEYEVKVFEAPAGYTARVDEEDPNTIIFKLNTVNVEIKAAVEPADADVSGLFLVVDGPDPLMPMTLGWADVKNGKVLTDLLPGAYLIHDINADRLVEGYTMDKEKSKVCDAVYVAEGSGTLEWKYAYTAPVPYESEEGFSQEAFENYDPKQYAKDNAKELAFKILGPDERMPMTVTLDKFTQKSDNANVWEYTNLPDLAPGVYTVVELKAEKLVKYYTLTSDSKTALKLEVKAGETETARLVNQYVPAPTPEPDAEFVSIPVTKTWNDSNNKDGNRPVSITVRLYADGVEVDSHVLTEAENWQFTFADKPRYQEDNKTEIAYSVNEDDVALYAKEINGYNLANYYTPAVTSRTVAKAWQDNNNEQKIRPDSVAMTLSLVSGDSARTVAVVTLNQENGWTATVNNLPTIVDGQQAVYAWSEQDVIGYTLLEVTEQNAVMTFVNTPWERPAQPAQGAKPKTRGTLYITLDDYDTPLGVDVMINHVGDCFD